MIKELQFPNRATTPGSRHYYCVRIAPPKHHDDLALLFLWRQELRDILYRCSDPSVAQAKLRWYQEEFGRALEGKAQQPLAQALAELIQRHQLPLEPFSQMIKALEADLHTSGYGHVAALHEHCRRDSGSLLSLTTRICGGDEAESGCAEGLGAFIRLVDIIRNLGPDLTKGHRYLPADEMEKVDLNYISAAKPENHEKLRILLKTLATHALEWQTTALSSISRGSHPALAPALSLAAMNQALLAELEESAFPVMTQRVCLTPLRKFWITWRTSRRAKKWA